LLWGAWIIYLSLLPGSAGILKLFGIPHFDKVAHIGAYAIWSCLFLLAAFKNFHNTQSSTWWIVIGLILVGCGLEFAQYYLHEGRSFEVLDMVANGIGAICGIFGMAIFRKQFHSEPS
jgi:VanZ family protein